MCGYFRSLPYKPIESNANLPGRPELCGRFWVVTVLHLSHSVPQLALHDPLSIHAQKFKDLALQDKVRYEEEMKKYTPPPSAVGDVSDNSAKQNKERVTGKGKKSKRATKNQSSSEKSAKKTTRPTKTQSSAQKKTKPANKKLNTLL